MDDPTQGLSFGPQPEAPSLDFKTLASDVPPDALLNRSARHSFALGDSSPGIEATASLLQDGNETYLRQMAASKEESEFQQRKHDMLMGLIKSSPDGISKEDTDFVNNLNDLDYKRFRSAGTNLEELYAKRIVNTVYGRDDNESVAKGELVNPEAAHHYMDDAEKHATQMQFLNAEMESVRQAKKDQSWPGLISDIIGENIPIYGTFRLHNLITQAPVTSLLPGSNILEQISYLRSINDPQQFKDLVHNAAMSINNLEVREQFLANVGSFSLSDQALSNLGGVADIAMIGEAALGPVLKGLGKASIKAAGEATPDIGKAAGIIGDNRSAAVINGLKETQGVPLRDQQVIERKAWSYNGGGNEWLTGSPRNLTRGTTEKFVDLVNGNTRIIQDILENSPSVDRTNPDVLQRTLGKIYDLIGGKDKEGLSNSVLDVDSQHNALTNTESLHIRLGKTNGEQFSNKLSAQKFAKDYLPNHKLTDENFVNDNGKWHIRLDLDLPDTIDNFKDVIPEQDRIKTNLLNRVIGRFRNQSNVLGKGISEARKVVAHGNQKIFAAYRQIAQPIASLPKDERYKLSSILEMNRDHVDYTDPKNPIRGMFYKTRGEFEDAYQGKWGTMPSDKQINAYYSYIQLNQLDGMVRNAGWFRDNARLGVKNWSDKLSKDQTFAFQGRAVESVPGLNMRSKNTSTVFRFEPKIETRGKVPDWLSESQDYKNMLEASGRWFTDDIEEARWYQKEHPEGHLVSVEVPKKDLEKYRVSNMKDLGNKETPNNPVPFSRRPEKELYLPSDLARSKKPYQEPVLGDNVDSAIAVRNSDTGEITHIYSKLHMSDKQRELLQKELDGNAIILEPVDGLVTVPGYEGKRAVSHYVTATGQESRLSLDTAWKDGVHVINEHDWYIKQPQINDTWFKKDLAFATAPNELVAKQRAHAVEIARQMMLRDDPALDAFVSKNIGNGLTGSSFKSNFFEGGFDKNTPFFHTPAGIQTVDFHKMDGITKGRHPYNIRQQDRTFAGERDATNIPALIDEKDVHHIFQDGKLVDPYKALSIGMRSMTDIKLKRDYLLKSAELWANQFRDLLKPNYEQTKRDPMGTLYRPQYRDSVDSVTKINAENARVSIIRFAGMRTERDSMFESFMSRMDQMAYGALGDAKYNSVAPYMAPLLKDPVRAAKSLAATVHLGLFSPAQFLMQAMSLVTVMSVSPRQGLKAMSVYFPMLYALNSPELLEHSIGVAGKMGWDRGHYQEMMEALRRSGWNFVHGDQAILDAISAPKLFQGKVGKFVDWGNIFLTEGVRAHRLPAFATAYGEWRAANPGAKLTRSAEHAILSRADDLSNNMSAANNAVWNKGLASVPLQFMTFPMRLAEGYWGKNFTPRERIQMFAGYSLMFGIPTAVGGATFAWPVYDSVKKYLIDKNIPYDDKVTQAVLNGLPQMMIATATGSNFDFGKRFGQGGVTEFRDAIYQNKSLWDLATGAVGQTLGDIVATSAPFMKGVWSALNDDPNEKTYPLDSQEFMHMFQNITSVNAATKLVYAMNTHRWMSKYDQPMDNVTNPEAWTMAMTGANLESIDDVFLEKGVLKDRTKMDQRTMIQLEDLYHRALQEKDDKQRQQYISMAKMLAVRAGLPANKWSQALRQSLMGFDVNQAQSAIQRLELDSKKREMIQDIQ